MRVIGTNKRGPTGGVNKKEQDAEREQASAKKAWSDFESQTKVKPKQTYHKTKDNRMVRDESSQRSRAEGSGSFSDDGRQKLQLREDSPSARHRIDFETLEESFGYTFQSREFLERALTHRSALVQRERTDYERLEFLGDAVLGLTVAHLLSDFYPEANEGTLSKLRAALVNTQALAGVARDLDLGSYIRLGRGESASGGRERPSILADVTEAIFGAIYRDGGFDAVQRAAKAVFSSRIDKVNCSDPKTDLQEQLHLFGSDAPSYLVEMVEGPVHAPTFVTVVMVDGEIVGRGKGQTKKAGHQVAAASVMSRLAYSHSPLKLAPGQTALIPDLLLTEEQKNIEVA